MGIFVYMCIYVYILCKYSSFSNEFHLKFVLKQDFIFQVSISFHLIALVRKRGLTPYNILNEIVWLNIRKCVPHFLGLISGWPRRVLRAFRMVRLTKSHIGYCKHEHKATRINPTHVSVENEWEIGLE